MSADPRPLLAALDCILERRPLAECAQAIMQADRINAQVEADIADATATLDRISGQRRKAVKVATAIGRPELADEILEAIHAHDDAQLGFIIRRTSP